VAVTPAPFAAPGFKLGHWTDPGGRTGCTVLLAEKLVPAAVDVRGGAPGTRETDLLGPGKSVNGVDAVLLTGGSAFGLAAADGVVRWLYEQERGFPTAAVNVPIVAAAVIFDLVRGDVRWPDTAAGYAAVSDAGDQWYGGQLGAGAGAAVSKALGRQHAVRSGIGVGSVHSPVGTVSAVFVNNAFGDIVDDASGKYLTHPARGDKSTEDILMQSTAGKSSGQNTVIGAIAVSRPLDHDALTRITVAGHSGISRVIRPSHTPADGDTVFALATGQGTCSSADLMQLTTAAQTAVATALLNTIRFDQSE
jgi:L-aminopeptidase/D-esterase-like protein